MADSDTFRTRPGRRVVPEPRHPKEAASVPVAAPVSTPVPPPVVPVKPQRAAKQERPRLPPDEKAINFPVRVRQSLDARITDLVYQLRRQGVRTTKQEIAEMLLWELPDAPDDALVKRLDAFQRADGRRLSALEQLTRD